MKLERAPVGDTVTKQPWQGPVADGTQVTKFETPVPVAAEKYSEAYSPHSPLRSISEERGTQATVKIYTENVPQGAPELPKDQGRLLEYVAIAAAVFFAFQFFKRGK